MTIGLLNAMAGPAIPLPVALPMIWLAVPVIVSARLGLVSQDMTGQSKRQHRCQDGEGDANLARPESRRFRVHNHLLHFLMTGGEAECFERIRPAGIRRSGLLEAAVPAKRLPSL